jgi:hypothetical protein
MTGCFRRPAGLPKAKDKSAKPLSPPVVEKGEEKLVQPSLNQWMDVPGCSSQHAGVPPSVSIEVIWTTPSDKFHLFFLYNSYYFFVSLS